MTFKDVRNYEVATLLETMSDGKSDNFVHVPFENLFTSLVSSPANPAMTYKSSPLAVKQGPPLPFISAEVGNFFQFDDSISNSCKSFNLPTFAQPPKQ